MSVWRQLTRGLHVLTRRSSADRDLTDEIEHYLEAATAAHVARGLSPDEAQRAARLELGGPAQIRDEVRASGWEHVIDTSLADVRYAARRLRSTPGFTAIGVLTLALGIGATTAIFSALKPILLESLPYPEGNRIVSVIEAHANGARSDGTFALYRWFLERARSLEAIAVYKPWRPAMTGMDQPERFEGQRVSADYFRVLHVSPRVGRDFDATDDRLRGPNVVMLSDTLWRRRFNADPVIVGREIMLDDNLFTVIGVMPGRFENVLAPSAELWALMQYDASVPAQGREWGHHMKTIARLAAGATVEQATREIGALGRAVVTERHPETYDPATQFAVAPLHDEITSGVRPALLAILGAVALVLIIACVNVTNLLLARGVQRRGEFALRAALGAGRARLVRQLLTESILLACFGGVAGVAVAIAGVRALIALSPPGLPRLGAIHADATVFAAGAAVTTIVGLAFGLMPALQAARNDPHGDLQHNAQRTGGGHQRTRRALVVAEIALALVLLVSSGLLLRSLERLFAQPAGFEAPGLLTMQVQIAGHRFDQSPARFRFFEQALAAVRRLPGVTSAGLTSQLPLSGDRDQYGAHFDATPDQQAATYGVFRYAVSPGYLETMQVPLRAGRFLDEHDAAGTPLVALISESLANARFHGNALGARLRIGPAGPFTIVGVVGDVKQLSLALSEPDAVYISPAQSWFISWFADSSMSVVVRARGDAASLAPALRAAIWSVDKDQPIVRVATMDELLAATAAERRFSLTLFEAFAVVALVLAAAGIYGILSGSVAERTREIGVRAALGASRADILALVLGQGMTLTVLGVTIGLAGAAAASQALRTMLFGISRLDPVTYVAVTVLLTGVSAIACSVPAWRAVRVDPASTLRAE